MEKTLQFNLKDLIGQVITFHTLITFIKLQDIQWAIIKKIRLQVLNMNFVQELKSLEEIIIKYKILKELEKF